MSWKATLLWAYTIPHWEHGGRLENDPEMLKNTVCPKATYISERDIEKSIEEWIKAGIVKKDKGSFCEELVAVDYWKSNWGLYRNPEKPVKYANAEKSA